MFTADFLQQLLLSGALFLFVWYLIGGKLLRPHIELLIERENRTVGDEQRATEFQEETRRTTIRIEEALREARMRGIAKRDQLLSEAKARAQETLSAAQDDALAKLERSRKQLASEIERAEKDVDAQASALSEVVLGRIMSEGSRYTVH